MSKKTKGIVAAGLGGVLLLGTAGTFATWSDSHTIDAGTISTGKLDVDGVEELHWFHNGTEITDLSKFAMVPGDTIIGRAQVKSSLEGEKLQAKLTVNGQELESGAVFGEFRENFDVQWALGSDNAWNKEFKGSTEGLSATLNAPKDNHKNYVFVKLTFDAESTEAMDETFSLGSITVNLTQTAPAAA